MDAGALDPRSVGIGLRAPHYRALARRPPRVDFLEVHSENFFAAGGASLAWLERFRAAHALSLHGVGLSLGSADPLDERHLARVEALARRFEPALVSEHLCWTSAGGRHAHELLPLPFTEACVAHVARRIERVQERLRRTILVENVTAYVRAGDSEMPEWAFVAEVARRSGCGLLLDVANVWVNAVNHGFDAREYLQALPGDAVGEIHVAGFEAAPEGLIDTHGAAVSGEVWALYEAAVARFGPRPTLVERDANLPPVDTLVGEAHRARALMAAARQPEAACA
jgi:uncharacterized protein